MNVKLLTEHLLEFLSLSLTGGYTGSSESIHATLLEITCRFSNILIGIAHRLVKSLPFGHAFFCIDGHLRYLIRIHSVSPPMASLYLIIDVRTAS